EGPKARPAGELWVRPCVIRGTEGRLAPPAAAPTDSPGRYVTAARARPPGGRAIPGGITNALQESRHETLASDRPHRGRGGPVPYRAAGPGAGVGRPPRRGP